MLSKSCGLRVVLVGIGGDLLVEICYWKRHDNKNSGSKSTACNYWILFVDYVEI